MATLQLSTPKTNLPPSVLRSAPREPRFDLLDAASGRRSRGVTLTASMVVHTLLAAAIVLVPLLAFEELAPPTDAVRAFFVAPPLVTPPPPPPPPPPPSAVRRHEAAAPTPPPVKENAFRAPVEVPDALPPETIDLGADLGIEGGVEGGVEGGMAGGVVGGIVGGVVGALPTPAPEPVRVGGHIKPPALLRRVEPVYPLVAARARMRGVVLLECTVDTQGAVTNVRILRGLPLLDEAAVTAVQQWRYRPLLLNGIATPFVLAVTVNFNLTGAGAL